MTRRKKSEPPPDVVGLFVEACKGCADLDADTKQVVFTDDQRDVYHRRCLPEEYWLETHGWPSIFGDE